MIEMLAVDDLRRRDHRCGGEYGLVTVALLGRVVGELPGRQVRAIVLPPGRDPFRIRLLFAAGREDPCQDHDQ
ncbi:hypothetical protein [Streptomyces roseolus]|uniref:hypothetical protein n=1 Tax=Streptomyces roseolus TaxID=67358 RepID=UPI0036E9B686